MPRRCSVGARFRSTGCSAITSSSTSQTSSVIESTYFFAALMFCTDLRSTSRLMMNGLKSSSAISFGSPHWWSFRYGPATITERPLGGVVGVDPPPVEVVQVARREAAAVELDHRPQLRRDDRDRLEDHPLGLVLRGDERAHDLEPLDRALLLLALRRLDRLAQRRRLGLQVEVLEQLADRLRAHP